MPRVKIQTTGSKEIVIGGISSRDQLMLVQQLHAGVRAGYSITDTLALGLSQSKGRMKLVLTDVISLVKNGAYLFEAFSKYPKYFSPFFINIIKTGELSASLEGSLLELHDSLKREAEFTQKIRSALTYPTFVFIAVMGLGLSVSFFVLPNLLPLFQSLGTELPTSTKILMWFAKAFKEHGKEIFWSIVIFVISFTLFIKWKRSKFITHWVLLRIPIFGKLYKKIMMAHLARTMNSLLKSGITIDQSLKYTADVLTNLYYHKAVLEAVPLISKGDTLAGTLEAYPKLFDSLFIQMIALGEKTSSFEESFFNISDFFENEVDNQTKNLMTSLEPLLLIFVGLIVGFVAISILGPIYSISGSIR